MTGIIDRIEDGFAVVELDGGVCSIPLSDAPAGVREGQVVKVEDGRIVSVDEEATARRAAAMHSRFQRLRRRK